jgi:protein-S-isoprenylcysteine O-methyltransferase Ste14
LSKSRPWCSAARRWYRILFVSRHSLLHPHSHGFYRLFAWEALLGLLVLNLEGWFREPWAWHQLISWALLGVSLALVVEGLRLLKTAGGQAGGRGDSQLLEFEKTSRLVTTGLYRYIRHPLYSSLLWLGWGMFFKSPSWPGAALALLGASFLVATARAEERKNIAYFGSAYRD